MKLLLLYTDPGSGIMLLQILLAFGASSIFYFRKFFFKLLGRGNPVNDNVESKGISEPTTRDETGK